jgi:hypothetical protein
MDPFYLRECGLVSFCFQMKDWFILQIFSFNVSVFFYQFVN